MSYFACSVACLDVLAECGAEETKADERSETGLGSSNAVCIITY